MSTVTAIILSHNAGPMVGQAIDSAVSQTAVPMEVLVIDDSTDDTPGIVEKHAKDAGGRLVQLVRVEPSNVSAARNLGLERAQGQYIAFLDADDIWMPDKLERQLELVLEDADAVGAFTPYFDFVTYLDDRNRHVAKPGVDDPSLRDILMGQYVASSTMLFRRAALCGLRFDEHAPDGEDVIFAAELRLRGRWRRVDEPLVAKRLHAAQASAGHWHQVRNFRTRIEWVRRRRPAISDGVAGELENELCSRLVEYLEKRYWRRELTDLRPLCDEARDICPDHFKKSELSRKWIFPRWVYRVRDMIRK
jgi:glycosyltransferase involved in cell wall biosynthesis